MKRHDLAGTILVGTLSVALAACGGGDGDSDVGPGTPDIEPSGSASTEAGVPADDEGVPPTPPQARASAPYQNGYVLSSIVGEIITTGFVAPAIEFETDERTNTISDNIFANVYPDLAYDEQGRATTIDYQFGEPVTLAYNDDGTLARVEQAMANGGLSFSDYEYEGGNLTVRRRGRTEDGETTIGGRIEYEYSADGTLTSATDFFRDRTDPSSTYRYVTDAAGRISEVADIDSAGNLRDRTVFAYDEFSNITRMELFDDEGSLRVVTTYTYAPSSEPVVNVISLFSVLTGDYIPDPDSFEYF